MGATGPRRDGPHVRSRFGHTLSQYPLGEPPRLHSHWPVQYASERTDYELLGEIARLQ